MRLSKTKRGCTLRFYETDNGGKQRWRWRLKHSNGNIICSSTEAFASEHNARRNAKSTRDGLVAGLS